MHQKSKISKSLQHKLLISATKPLLEQVLDMALAIDVEDVSKVIKKLSLLEKTSKKISKEIEELNDDYIKVNK